ncbi:diheme cytochrome SoxA (sulfur oxidation) [Sulfuricella denitrificans skB26]|uniref:SoxAX cytochrome complex subunit A n=1 Tax=Sulfuricella denitrificans (strain DSM 22764 / NBRC 105220 / skB26) TaxID=1163617 RepID=S6B6W8_SULDS|nr:sulfur oxidation c-type cytochrome SoxA [Sulfuricella denitrificans]BAN36217.1 diheme cytochrome SoxA (sulfur oxidation) [Sulfuricella denitrificans skB26]
MKRRLTVLLACLFLGASLAASAGPAEDRKALTAHYKQLLPGVKFQDYVLGALALNKDALDQYESIMMFPPFVNDVDDGRKTWEKPFKNGKTFASCFRNGGKKVAGGYPYFDNGVGKVLTFENALNACLRHNDEAELKYGSTELGLLSAYAKSLSDGMKVQVKVEGPAALAAYENGKTHYYSRRGQLNFSCASCHVDNVGKFVRSEQLSPMIGQAAHWPEFRAGTELVTLQGRFRQCQKNVRATPLDYNSEEYNDLEYFLTYMSNGLPMQTPVFRK